MVRPCPPCLIDLRRLEARPVEADRIRSGIEARAIAGRAAAEGPDDSELVGAGGRAPAVGAAPAQGLRRRSPRGPAGGLRPRLRALVGVALAGCLKR